MLKLKKAKIISGIFLCAVLFFAGCGSKTETPKVTQKKISQKLVTILEDKKVEYQLTEYFEVAEVFGAVEKLEFVDQTEARFHNSGWDAFEISKAGEGRRWINSRCAVLDFPRSTTSPISVSLILSPIGGHKLIPEQEVFFDWNGTPVGKAKLKAKEKQKVTLKIPSDTQRLGMNRLSIKPKFWISPGRLMEKGSMTRNLSLLCWGAEITPVAHFLGGDGAVPATLEKDSIIQFPGSVVSYYFSLPKNATLRGEGKLITKDLNIPPRSEGLVTISLVDSKGKEHIIISRTIFDLLNNPVVKFKKDISSFSETMVSINFAFSVKKPSGKNSTDLSKLKFSWKNPRLSGKEEGFKEKKKKPAKEKPNIIVILFDALRADHIGPYGSTTVQTPNLDDMASQGTTFMNNFSTTSWTRCSVTSILTSLNPGAHKTLDRNDSLSDEVQYLPEILQGLGYHTVAMINNGNIGAQYGYARGYDKFEDFYKSQEYKNEKNDQAKFLQTNLIEPFLDNPGEKPFFIYIHERDPHDPYEAPAPWNKMYYPEYNGKMGLSVKEMDLLNPGYMQMGSPDLKYVISQYDGEITYMDRMVGWINKKLKETGLDKNTLVIFISDHGEEFMDHGRMRHGQNLYDHQIRVPLICKLPGVFPEGRKQEAFTQLTDIPPTILDLLGFEIPESMQGKSVLPLLKLPEDYSSNRICTAQLKLDKRDEFSVRYKTWKLSGKEMGGYRPWRLYNMEKDPGEKDDRWVSELIVGKTLHQMLNYQIIQDGKTKTKAPISIDESQLDPDELANLKALGYIR